MKRGAGGCGYPNVVTTYPISSLDTKISLQISLHTVDVSITQVHLKASLNLSILQVLEEDSGMLDQIIKANQVPFSSNGTMLWRVKLIPRGEQVPCPVPHVKATFPHQYDFIFRAHHAIGDGIDGATIIQCILDALDSVLIGRPVDDKEWGDYDDKQDAQILKESAKENLRKDSKRFDVVRSTLPPADTTPLLLQVFPRPDVTEATTRYVERDMDPQILKDFLKNVQKAGISFNTSFSAVLNTAIVELAREAGLVQDTYTITGNHLVSLRGLLKKKSRFRIGPYTSRLSHSSNVSPDVKSHFWEYSQKLHQEFRVCLKSGLMLEQDAVTRLAEPEVSPDDYFTKPQPIHHDYTINNLGIIPHSPYENYDQVQLTNFFTYNVVHNFFHYNMHQLIIFRDQCGYTLSYDTQYFSAETANIFADKIQSVISDVAKNC